MKLYVVEKDTKVMVRNHNATCPNDAQGWVTRHRNTFTETVIDPIRLYNLQNNPGRIYELLQIPEFAKKAAEQGIYIFESGTWYMLVPSRSVQVLC